MKVNMVTDRIATGSDVSGTNYLVSSSYANNLVRRTPIVSSSTSTDSTDSGAQVIGSRVSVNTTSSSSSNYNTSSTTSQPSSSTSSSTSSYSY
jgi:hypothetical protein